MTFGGQARLRGAISGSGSASVGGAGRARFIGLATAVLITFFLLISAGCGGGGSSSPSGNGGGSPTGNTSDAFVTGRVLDAANGQPLAGASVQYGNVGAVTTAADGTFSIRVRSKWP